MTASEKRKERAVALGGVVELQRNYDFLDAAYMMLSQVDVRPADIKRIKDMLSDIMDEVDGKGDTCIGVVLGEADE